MAATDPPIDRKAAIRAAFEQAAKRASAPPEPIEVRLRRDALELAEAVLKKGKATADLKEQTAALTAAVSTMKTFGIGLEEKTAVMNPVIELHEAEDAGDDVDGPTDRSDSDRSEPAADARASAH